MAEGGCDSERWQLRAESAPAVRWRAQQVGAALLQAHEQAPGTVNNTKDGSRHETHRWGGGRGLDFNSGRG